MKQSVATEKIGAVLVCGAGIAGIQASLDLAEGGFKVFLLDSSPAIGGRMAQLDKTFPTGDCAMCILSPKLVECARNRNIEIITLADVQSLSGKPGNFRVKIRQNPRYVDTAKCDACGNCANVCPVTLPSEFDLGLDKRKAIFRPYSQAIPDVYTISKSSGTAPCKAGCPAGVNVQGYIALTAAGKIGEAYELIRQRCPLPATAGRVCPHPCQEKCNRNGIDEAVSARNIKRFVADTILANPDGYPPFALPAHGLENRVAVVGGGPAGLTAASDLTLAGYKVTLFEARPQLGGMLRYGIPGYRLPKEILDKEISGLLGLGIEVNTNTAITNARRLLSKTPDPKEPDYPHGFDAVFLAAGAWKGLKLAIPGENAPGVLDGLSFIIDVNIGKAPKIGPKVLVIGGSDMALHAARMALRLPGVDSVHLACLESRAEMPAHSWEAAEALEEGVIFHNSLGPTRIAISEEKAGGVTFRACTSVFDEFKRFDPLFDDSAISTISADTVIVAAGRAVDAHRLGLEMRPGGRILTDKETLGTSVPGIFAGGDAVLGPASMVEAMAQGHRAAESIDAYIRGSASIRSAGFARVSASVASGSSPAKLAPNPTPDAPVREHVPMPRLASWQRIGSFIETDLGYGREQAISEAQRCLSCGLCSECMQCLGACSAGAVMHDQQATEFDIEVGSIIFAPGVDEFQSSLLKEYGHGSYADVLSSLQFERMLSVTGPTGGRVRRPSNGGDVKRLAFIQCVGSRDAAGGSGYCSSICCMNTAKLAMTAVEHESAASLEVSVFGMDVRAAGKEADSYIQRAGEYGIEHIKAVPSSITEIPGSGNLRISYTDGTGVERVQDFDLVVLSAGVRVPERVKESARRLNIDLNSFGFAKTQRFSPVAASKPGIFVTGAFQEPKDIPDSVSQGSAAAACAMEQLTAVRGTMIRRNEYPWERDTTDEPPRIGVFVCHCGHNIASIVDVDWVAGKAAKLPDVVYSEANTYICSETSQQHIKEIIKKHRLNRLVVASCSSRTHEALFQETVRQSGLNKYLFAMTNIRDQCSWVHRSNPAAATAKAIDLVSMAVARARHLKALPLIELPVTASALVLGGGLAGMTAALNIADQGYKVLLVEREQNLGGLLRCIHSTLEHADVQSYLRQITARIVSHPNIRLYTQSRLVRISGQVGNFRSVVDVAGQEVQAEHGVVIIATGGEERETAMYLHGRNPNVMTQSKLESVLADEALLSAVQGKRNPTIAMIQCVESRSEKKPYCSRICCSEAIKNALRIKQLLPDSVVAVLGRDFRLFGFREHFLQSAVEQGIQLIRFSEKDGPVVAERNGRLHLKVHDASARRAISLNPDLIVLSNGIAPGSDNAAIASMLRSALSADGFFLEAHPKIRPVDLANEGEFVCGLAHSPRFMDETIAQAQAVAARAATILSKPQLEILGQVARVNPINCVACATCVKVCPFGAPSINEIKKAEIHGAKCTGCGSCVAACPARTITLHHQESETVSAMLDKVVAGGGYL